MLDFEVHASLNLHLARVCQRSDIRFVNLFYLDHGLVGVVYFLSL